MEPGAVRSQLDRILASRVFLDAERASRFLSFVTERALQGRASEIKESVIAIEAFGRNSSFDPKYDPVVRVEARRLRDRLSAYYATEGVADGILIHLPKGGYVPEFAERPQAEQQFRIKWVSIARLAGWVLFAVSTAALALFYSRKPDRTGTLRLSILPPQGAAFESFAISPDGRKLAFTADFNGKLMLWVRQLDSLDAKPLPGTEDASYPFWSPDSRSIGFYTIFKLKTIDISGGPARSIANTVVGRGGAWSPTGQIVFCPRPIGILYQVPAAGGMPKPATALDATRAEISHGMPQFLPDGRHFLFVAGSSRAGESSVRLGSLDSPASKVLLDTDTTSVAYAPVLAGHPSSFLFVHNSALMAQPFDLRRLEVKGEPTILVPEVRRRRWRQISFSVSSNGVLVYLAGSVYNQQLAWFDRNGKLLESVGPRNDYVALSLSPDEKHVAVWNDDDPATALPTIWLTDLSRDGSVSRFTDPAAGEPEFLPTWSPSGVELLFSRGDERRMRLLVQPLSSGPAKTVLDTDGPKFPTDWSSDGRFIAFGSQWPDYRYMHTWTMPLSSSGEAEQPAPFLRHAYAEGNASFSPTDRGQAPQWVAYTSNETGSYEVYVRNFPTGSQKWRVSTHGGCQPHWRRDGRELFYLTLDGTLMAVPIKAAAGFEAGPPQSLFETGLQIATIVMNQYAVSRDGRRFLFNRRLPEAAPGAITTLVPW
ncbi:MAG TPA: hypothetical protein VH369_23770 [Bryobacteraceae bacterium]|jgi:Tol biopolymer transport system component